jgi:hypothetical protein
LVRRARNRVHQIFEVETMRLVLAIAAALAFPALAQTPLPAGTEAQLIDLEKQSWAAWQKKDLAFWEQHLSADHVEIDGPDGPQDRAFVLKGVANRACAVASYDLDRFTFRQLDADTALLIYHAAQDFACGDKRIPNVGWVTSLYQRRNGRWENVLFEHLQVPSPKPTEPPKP